MKIKLIVFSLVIAALSFGMMSCDTSSDVPAQHEHVSGDWVVVSEPGCTSEGVQEKRCVECNEITDSQVLSALGHVEVKKDAVAPTCTENGLTEGKYCERCNQVLEEQNIVYSAGHREQYHDAIAPTCTETGMSACSVCQVCDAIVVEAEVVPATGHTNAYRGNGYDATCLEDGLTDEIFCETCNVILTESTVIEAYGHKDVDIPEVPATCASEGKTKGVKCSVCDEILVEGEIIPKSTTHTYENKLCTVCGAKAPSQGIEYVLREDEDGNRYYSVNSLGSCQDEEIIIPATFNGLPVKAIDPDAFLNTNGRIKGIVLPEGLESIGSHAFHTCYNIKSIIIPSTVKTIGSSAFVGTGLVSITFAENSSLEFIGDHAFQECDDLESIVLPEGLKTIANSAFSQCKNLKSVTIPSTLKYVGDSAFIYCAKLENVYISDLTAWCNIEYENYLAESYCANPLSYAKHLYLNGELVTEVVVPDGVTFIPEDAFSTADIVSVTLPEGLLKIGNAAFNLAGITSIVIPDSVTEIGSFAFAGCEKLESVTMSKNLKTMGTYAFYNCKNLKNIELYEGVTQIPTSAFDYCASLEKIIIPNSVESISRSAFSGCSSLKELKLSENLTFIGTYAFSGSAIESLVIPGSVKIIETEAFRYSTALQTVVINEGLEYINYSAFYACKALESITLPTTLKSIDATAFAGCDSLKKLYVSDLEKWCQVELGDYDASPLHNGGTMYINNEAVTDLVIPETVTTINAYTFYGMDMQTVSIHSEVVAIGKSAFGNCDWLVTVIIPSSVNTMGYGVFQASERITQVLCEADYKPRGWDADWNYYVKNNAEIVWGYAE